MRWAALQGMRCKDVQWLLEDYRSMVPGAWSASGALAKDLAQLSEDERMKMDAFAVARFSHLTLHDLRSADVPELLSAHRRLTSLQH